MVDLTARGQTCTHVLLHVPPPPPLHLQAVYLLALSNGGRLLSAEVKGRAGNGSEAGG